MEFQDISQEELDTLLTQLDENEELHFSNTEINITPIMEALKTNNTIKSLGLHAGNDVELHEEATALAEVLKVNTTITSLDLEEFDLGPEGRIALAEALKTK